MTDQIKVDKAALQRVFDTAVHSMDFSSGFLDDEEVEALRAVAILLDVDPETATPDKFRNKYGLLDKFQVWDMETCHAIPPGVPFKHEDMCRQRGIHYEHGNLHSPKWQNPTGEMTPCPFCNESPCEECSRFAGYPEGFVFPKCDDGCNGFSCPYCGRCTAKCPNFKCVREQ